MEPVVNRCKGFLKTLEKEIYTDEVPAEQILRKEVGYNERQVMLEDTSEIGWEPFANGSRFGGREYHACFRTLFTVRPEQDGRDIWLTIRTGVTDIWNTDNPQFLIYVDGKIVCGMDMNHHELRITECGLPGKSYDIGIYAYSNSANISDYLNVSFVSKHVEVEKLYYDFKVICDACLELNPDNSLRICMLDVLNRVVNDTYLVRVPSPAFYESVKKVDEELCREFYDKLDGESYATVHSIGHTHIDVAWKWPVRQTREKAIRSFATVLDNMDNFPEYRFMSSQPQLYEFVKEEAPEVYERIKERVKEGRWETEGAMWLEADCNLTSGESLVRQILYGNAFFKEEFGAEDNKILWLPDVFGYSAALPQILKKSGIKYFMTTKIGWNEYNRMPHDVMMWRGIDGSEILTYFITTTDHKLNGVPNRETTYNGRQNVSQVMGTWQRFSDKELSDEVLTCYGFGDGGGGPTRQMLEESRRMSRGIPGVPTVKQTFARDFFEILEEKLKGRKIPKWCGELYLEYHRGTYTSMAKNKKYNRVAEFMNNQAEALSLWAGLRRADFLYPTGELKKIWQTTLLNQFHDILPGSSIKDVYDVTTEEYEEILEKDNDLMAKATAVIAGDTGENLTIYNMLPFERDTLVETVNGPLYVDSIPSMGYRVIAKSDSPLAESSFSYDEKARLLQTPFYQASFNDDGEIVSLYDKQAGRECVAEGEAFNKLIAFEDRPWEYDAWNIDSYYDEKPMALKTVEFKVIENTHERFTFRICRQFEQSEVTQRVSFYRNSRRIDFKTHADWKEQQILLKAAFHADIMTDKCTCDIQFGNVERPTHRNTSWDEARFEICSHKWVDVSESGYGIAVLNDCKYGSDVNGATVRLTLIKSGIFPNPDADKGEHEFTYAIYPHLGDFREAGVDREAYKLNLPVLLTETERPAGETAFLYSVDADNVHAGTFKLAEDGRGMILRMHETFGKRTKVTVTLSEATAAAVIPCDLMEHDLGESVALKDGKFTVTIKPYEILTFRLL